MVFIYVHVVTSVVLFKMSFQQHLPTPPNNRKAPSDQASSQPNGNFLTSFGRGVDQPRETIHHPTRSASGLQGEDWSPVTG